MSAYDEFNNFNDSLSDKNREALRLFIHARRADLLAARSEDARLRIVQEYLSEAHRRLRGQK